jgi:chaperone required for assembly of F1-ATPase
MKRFWDEARPAPHQHGFAIHLDGRPLRLPGGAELVLPGAALAEAVAGEWQAAGGKKGGEMSFADTPLTRLAGTAQERIAPDPAASVDALAAYGGNDLLCYRADSPEGLARRQAERWQPWLDWAARSLDAPLHVTRGIIHVPQPPDALAALRRAVAGQPPMVLAGLGIAVPALGSLVLGLALAAGEIDAAGAHELSILDELFQEELWGTDEEALARRRAIAADLAVAARLMRLAVS